MRTQRPCVQRESRDIPFSLQEAQGPKVCVAQIIASQRGVGNTGSPACARNTPALGESNSSRISRRKHSTDPEACSWQEASLRLFVSKRTLRDQWLLILPFCQIPTNTLLMVLASFRALNGQVIHHRAAQPLVMGHLAHSRCQPGHGNTPYPGAAPCIHAVCGPVTLVRMRRKAFSCRCQVVIV